MSESVSQEEFRVEVELDDDEHHLSLGERLRAVDLDDEARDRLGSRVIVTRDGSHLFLYAQTQESCEEAERVVRELIAEDELTASVRSTRWHPVEEDWKDISHPLPSSRETSRENCPAHTSLRVTIAGLKLTILARTCSTTPYLP